jgi:uncharacterized membrane protein (UPF0182 family)
VFEYKAAAARDSTGYEVSATDTIRRLAGPRVRGRAYLLGVALATLIAVLVALDWAAEFLWFDALGYPVVFWTLRLLKLSQFATAFVVVLAYLWWNARLIGARVGWSVVFAAASGALRAPSGPAPATRRDPKVPLVVVLLVLVASLAFALVLAGNWDALLRFAWASDYGLDDPVFGRDIGFYLFVLPYLELVQNTVVTASLLVLATLAWVYTASGALGLRAGLEVVAEPPVLRHLGANLTIFLVACGVGYYLDRYELLLSDAGAVFGAGYTAVKVEQWCLAAMALGTLALAGASNFLSVLRHGRFLVRLLGGFLALWIVAVAVIPWTVQGLVVEPNELDLETPYLRHNIAFTREAYGLTGVEERPHTGAGRLTRATLSDNRDTIDNIRLWDWRPLSQAFRQLQRIRTYYEFGDVDVDRYRIEGEYRQVMLATRELSPGRRAPTRGARPPSAHGARADVLRARDLLWRAARRLPPGAHCGQGVRLPAGRRQCLHRVPRPRRHRVGRILEAAALRLGPVRPEPADHALRDAGQPAPALADAR